MAINRRIISIWLSLDGIIPSLVAECLESQKIPGYEHKLIDLNNCYRGSRYVNEALAKAEEAKSIPHLVKAADWLKCWHIHDEGGIFLDSDVQILPGKNFDSMLEDKMFVVAEPRKTICNGIFGAEKGHPLLKEYCDRIENNYRGEGDLVLRPGVQSFADIIWATYNQKRYEELGLRTYGPELFFPYVHETGLVNILPETITYHHYTKSWCVDGSASMIK